MPVHSIIQSVSQSINKTEVCSAPTTVRAQMH